jgi:GNAT superfamily N-acetyltransferase
MPVEIRILGKNETGVLTRTAPDVFDNPVNAHWCTEFLSDPRHHLAVALDRDTVVGMASGVHYVHPDKPPELWVNEVGVASTHRGEGVGKRLLQALFAHGHGLGCAEAWVLTEKPNTAARRLYASVGGREDAEAIVYVTFSLNEADESN